MYSLPWIVQGIMTDKGFLLAITPCLIYWWPYPAKTLWHNLQRIECDKFLVVEEERMRFAYGLSNPRCPTWILLTYLTLK